MKKMIEKLGKILTALVYTLYTFIAPLTVLNVHAYSNGEIIGDGTVSANNGKNPTDQGYINVTKTITHEDGDPEGVYTVNFNIKGTEYSSTHQVPSYTIFVLDASDSMNDRIGGWLSGTTRFAQAKAAIKAASSKLVENPNGKVALIEFGTDSDPDKIVGFKHGSLTDSDFKQSWGGTNYDAGLMNAKDLLNTIINEDGVKNIIFISDGEPTIGLVKHDDITNYNRWYQTNNYVYESYFDDYYYCTSDGQTYLNSNSESNPTVTGFSGHESGTYDPYRSTHTFNGITYQQNNTLESLKTILKGSNNDPHNNIYSFSYMVNDDDAKSILQEIATKDENGNARWKNVDANSIVTELDKIADEISQSAAGVDATLTDEVGADFSVINNGDFEVIEGDMSYSLDSIPTGDGENISFKIKINPYAATGEHDTNGSFDLKYKVNASDTEYEHITTSESPKVYWIAPESKIKVNYYLDGTTTSISAQVESEQKVVTNEDGTRNTYTAKAKDIFGYTLVKAKTEVFDGTTAAPSEDYTIADNGDATVLYYIDGTTVNYYYTKNDITINDSTAIDKDGDTDKKGLNSDFNYTIDYNIKVDDYIGKVGGSSDVQITVTDTLPFEIDEESSNLDGGTYNAENRTITWTIPETEITSEDNSTISFNKTIKVYYNNIDINTLKDNNDTLTNNVSATITKGTNTLKTVSDTYNNELAKGQVLVYHVDENGNLLIPTAEEINGYVDQDYTTSHKTNIVGYTWNEQVPNNANGLITSLPKTVTYVYTKNKGVNQIKSESLTKTGPASVESAINAFNYSISYRAEIENYVGNATLIIKDTPQYKVDQNKLSDELKAVYDENTNTFTWTVSVNGINGNRIITFDKNLELYYVKDDIKSNTVKNTVTSELSFTGEEEKSNLSKEVNTTIPEGVVNVHYYFDNVEKENTTLNGYVGNSYTTSRTPTNTSTYGYTLTDTVGPVSGSFAKNPIEVEFYYTKNNGTITDTLDKVITNAEEAVKSLDNKFKYTITYSATISDFVGNATLTITDTPSAPIIENESELDGGTYNEESNTITWTIPYTITEETTITVTKNIELIYIADEVTGSITNKVNTHLELENGSNSDKEKETEEIDPNKSNITELYVYIGENSETEISSKIGPTSDYVGKSYTITIKDIYGYTYKESENETNKYLKANTIIKHIYNKNTGNITDEETSKTTESEVSSINSEFTYTISYNATLNDYVGTATTTLIDYLPYAIDIEKSNIADGIYNEEDKTITWKVETNIDENHKDITINKEIRLFYLNITDKLVKNDLKVETNYDSNTSKTNDDATSEIKTGKVIVHFIDIDGNTLAEDETLEGLVGMPYTTYEKEIGTYYVEEIKGLTEGKYTVEDQEVTYVYDLSGTGGDDIIPPQTGYEIGYINNIVTIILIGLLLIKIKKYN